MNAFDILQSRGFFYQLTDETEIRKQLTDTRVTFYIGFDPTADSLHIGHLLPVMAARFLQRAGHRPIMVVGGGTAMIGDPSGKTEMRQMLTVETIAANADALKSQMTRFLDFGGSDAMLTNNYDWLAGLKYLEFLRDVGKHFSVNRMLQADSVKLRLQQESGLSFLEFNYMLLQAYDFYVLARDQNCTFQFGGQDQWGNIVAGVDLTRRMIGKSTYGATFPLLTDANGKKFGKTEGGAVWLDPARTSVFDYYQFWRNTADGDVEKLLKLFTGLPTDECERLGRLEAPAINRAKEILAYEATALAHGADAAADAYRTATEQFGSADKAGAIATTSALAGVQVRQLEDNLPTWDLSRSALSAELIICKLFADSGLESSSSAARRLIQGGGGYLNDAKLDDPNRVVVASDFVDGSLILRSGKKKFRRIVLVD